MAAGAQSQRVDVVGALRDAAFTGLVAFGLFLPLIGFQTVINGSNELDPDDALAAVVRVRRDRCRRPLCLFLRACSHGSRSAQRACANRAAGMARLSGDNWFVPFAIGFVIVYPAIVIFTAGFSGALKWIDNFGIQILIYVMLGWGLNIVVGLAGLLDLGYVAFYAVGAYSYALLAKNIRLGVLDICCRSPAFSRRSGASCSAFRSCGCAATISPSSRSPSARSSASS